MSFVIAQPEMIAAAAGELASIRSAINAANAAAAAQTTGVMSAAADEVSTAVAALFSSANPVSRVRRHRVLRLVGSLV